jgi:hypothetical protein
MKRKLVLFFSLLISFDLASQNLPYELVVTEFFKNYEYSNYEFQLKFQKKKEGWFVAEEGYYSQGQYENVQLFWSNSDRKFKELNYPTAENRSESELDSLMSNFFRSETEKEMELYNYTRNIYFGYAGWDWDVIQDYGAAENLGDTLLESLGRAYSSYALGYFFDQWGNTIQTNEQSRRKLTNEEKIDTIRRDKFIFYSNKCIAAYKKLVERNPSYETRVGSIGIKYANEFLFSYSSLCAAGFPKEAQQYIVANIYSDSILLLAKNYLASVAKNGILITSADNDTYPLWYLQQKENYRKDVVVINHSLLGSPRYIDWFNKMLNGKLVTTTPEVYNHPDFLVLYQNIKDSSVKKISIEQLIQGVQSRFKPGVVRIPEEMNDFPSKIITQTILKDKAILLYPSTKSNTVFSFTIPSYYLFVNDYLLFDIFFSNLYSRSLHFTYRETSTIFEPYMISSWICL